MKAEIVIPYGWRRIKRGNVKEGDLFVIWDRVGMNVDPGWEAAGDLDIGMEPGIYQFVIRRVPRAKRK